MNPIQDQFPSKCMDGYWISAKNLKWTKPATSRTGKFLIFVNIEKVDEVWKRIKKATEEDYLGICSKVSTARPNPNAKNTETKLICVYTYDFNDLEDLSRVAWKLYDLAIFTKGQLLYKTDEATFAGQYANRGCQNISSYKIKIEAVEGKTSKEFQDNFIAEQSNLKKRQRSENDAIPVKHKRAKVDPQAKTPSL